MKNNVQWMWQGANVICCKQSKQAGEMEMVQGLRQKRERQDKNSRIQSMCVSISTGSWKKKKLGPQLIYCRLGQVISPITDYSLNVSWIVRNKAFTELHIEQINYCCRQKQTKDTQTWVKGKWEKCTSFRRFWNMLLFESVWKRERKRRELQREILREISLKTDRD